MYRLDKREIPAIALAVANSLLSSFAIAYADDYGVIVELATASFVLFILICLRETANILFLARTFILGFIGYFAMIIKVLLGQDALFSGYERSTQGWEIVVVMYVATSYALLSNQIGIAWARQSSRRLNIQARIWQQPRKVRITYWWLAGICGIGLASFSAATYIRSYGQTILEAGYGMNEAAEGLPFGSVGVLGSVGIFSLFVAGMRGHIPHWRPIFFVVAVVFIIYSQLLMGVRQDAMSTLFGLVVLYGVLKGKSLPMKMSYMPVVLVAYVFFEAWGVARTALAEGIPISTIATLAFTNVGATDAVRLGTISPIATTFSNTVFLVDHHFVDLAFGRSYAEWILRIPPEALYPGRPRDYAWLFEDFGLLAGGGFFELAEVYMNFGLLGALTIPGLISFVLAKTYYYALSKQTVFSYFALFAFLAVFLRGTWYQTFAFFRAFLVCACLYVAYVFVVQLLRAVSTRHQLLDVRKVGASDV